MNKTIKIFTILTAVAALTGMFSLSAVAQIDVSSGDDFQLQVEAGVLEPKFSVQQEDPLDFGAFYCAHGGDTITIAPDDTWTSAGNSVQQAPGNHTRGQLTLNGPNLMVFSINFPGAPINIDKGADSLVVNSYDSLPATTGAAGEHTMSTDFDFRIGASLTVPDHDNVEYGIYSGVLPITLTFE